ncbi:RNA deprotection pyrophosphohydrolase [Virgibacillus sediminis]|uniref:RNA deprotection pyrophosphohydrolase n=1 Tax=Virgibacillus sediminis TaxID=202260 RepID=A0ABV7A2L3_9BACI
MYQFKDYYNNQVTLSFKDHPFSKTPGHVWVICRYKGKWLLTKHKGRGIEFPGGKVEKGETTKEAAIREVKEETGGDVGSICYIGQYHVDGKREKVVKNVYYAQVDSLSPQQTYYETDGPVVLSALPADIKEKLSYSFIMKDDVLVHCLEYIKNRLPAK